VNAVQRLTSLGVDDRCAGELSALRAGSGAVFSLSGDFPAWGDVVAAFSDGGDVREFFPAEGAWTVGELESTVLLSSRIPAETGVAHLVINDCDFLSSAVADRLLKTLEESSSVFWLCSANALSLPATIRGRVVSNVVVSYATGAGGAAAVCAATGCSLDRAVELLGLLDGRVPLAVHGVSDVLTGQVSAVGSSVRTLFASFDECDSFLDAFIALVNGKPLADAVSGWTRLNDKLKRQVRAELILWFAREHVLVVDESSARYAQLVRDRHAEVVSLLRANVSPVHALSFAVAG
jgi:hypothetical protein